jgi:hypothetical protein
VFRLLPSASRRGSRRGGLRRLHRGRLRDWNILLFTPIDIVLAWTWLARSGSPQLARVSGLTRRPEPPGRRVGEGLDLGHEMPSWASTGAQARRPLAAAQFA